MVMERVHHGEPRYEGITAHDRLVKRSFSAAQITAIAIGVLFIAAGVLGLWRSGLHSTTTPTVEVGRLGMTPILAVAHIGVGVLALIGASNADFARGVMTVIGFGLVALGVAILIQPPPSLGVQRDNGFAYLLVGALAMASAILTPAVTEETQEP